MNELAARKCACCGKSIKGEPKTIMDNQMHRYVCSEKCMWDYYKKGAQND